MTERSQFGHRGADLPALLLAAAHLHDHLAASRGAIGGLNEEPRAAVDDDGLARHNVPALLASHTHVSAMSDFSPMRRIGAQVEAWNYDGVIHALAEEPHACRHPAWRLLNHEIAAAIRRLRLGGRRDLGDRVRWNSRKSPRGRGVKR